MFLTFSNKLEGAEAGEREKTIYLSQLKTARYIVFSASSRLEFASIASLKKLKFLNSVFSIIILLFIENLFRK